MNKTQELTWITTTSAKLRWKYKLEGKRYSRSTIYYFNIFQEAAVPNTFVVRITSNSQEDPPFNTDSLPIFYNVPEARAYAMGVIAGTEWSEAGTGHWELPNSKDKKGHEHG